MINRKNTKKINIANTYIGGSDNILIQSMCNTKTTNVEECIEQILQLEDAGCEIIRVSAPDMESAKAINIIKQKIHIPIVADIHFDYKLALSSIENGADKIRINPGNIGSIEKVKLICEKAKAYKVPIRVGVNSGSISSTILQKYNNKVCANALVDSCLYCINILEQFDFRDIVVSIKSSDILMCIQAYKQIASKTIYPLHVGITESGTLWSGNIKSSIGLSLILNENIGNTIRVSLSANPIEEVKSAKLILQTLGLRSDGIKIISCPTCARTNIDIINLSKKVEDILLLKYPNKKIKVAIMGCAVNGPGEASNADIGIAGGIGEGLIFKKGKIIRKVKEENLLEELLKEIEKI
ncbi:MAG: flavodoxin-dependent (E)-4-hydroxy-3-methylbut-2-enyl-diphosphate synthase [Eubacteriales bacterium]|nr:flavodoxin-dependent (E)-4-hydroxy-3-methylbut-2-enyl-diphosphate synthase [Eubacteriales bacterium]